MNELGLVNAADTEHAGHQHGADSYHSADEYRPDVRDSRPAPPPNLTKENSLDYDRCVEDGCIEVEPVEGTRIGGNIGKSDEHRLFSIFTADRRKGGCGTTWARSSQEQIADDQAKGIDSKWKVSSAVTGRVMSVPSAAFTDNYDQAFQKGKYAPALAERTT